MRRINIALFLVNRVISNEALDVLYEVNTIRLHYPKQLDPDVCGGINLLALVHNLELVNDTDNRCWHIDTGSELSSILTSLRQRPKLKNVTIGCDEIGVAHFTVRQYVEGILQTSQLCCVDIGHDQLKRKWSHVHFKRGRLTERWKDVTNVTAYYDVFSEVEEAMQTDQSAGPTGRRKMLAVTMMSLRRWVMMHHESERVVNHLEGPNEVSVWERLKKLLYLNTFSDGLADSKAIGPAIRDYSKIGNVTSIKDLCAGSDSDTLE